MLQLQTESQLLMIDSQTYKTHGSSENSNYPPHRVSFGKSRIVLEGFQKNFVIEFNNVLGKE